MTTVKYVAGGDSQGDEYGDIGPLAYSYNGLDWTNVASSIGMFTHVNSIACNGTMWIATGNPGTDSMAYSYDGITWIGLGAVNFDQICNGVAWSDDLGMWVAVGKGTYNVAYSYDGLNWTGLHMGGANTVCVLVFYATTLSKWFIGVNLTSPVLFDSPDGINWTGVADNKILSYLSDMAFDGTTFVVVGLGSSHTTEHSIDGVNWTGDGKPFGNYIWNSIANNGSRFVVATQADYDLGYSDDGANWTGVGIDAASVWSAGAGYIVRYGNSIWIAGGSTNAVGAVTPETSILYSANGIDWADVNNDPFYYYYADWDESYATCYGLYYYDFPEAANIYAVNVLME